MEETAMPHGQARIEPGDHTQMEHKRKPLWKKYLWGYLFLVPAISRSLLSFCGCRF